MKHLSFIPKQVWHVQGFHGAEHRENFYANQNLWDVTYIFNSHHFLLLHQRLHFTPIFHPMGYASYILYNYISPKMYVCSERAS